MFLIKFFLKIAAKSKLTVKLEVFFSFVFLILTTILISFTPIFFKKILDKIDLHHDATVNILIYGICFKLGSIISQNIRDILFAYFSS